MATATLQSLVINLTAQTARFTKPLQNAQKRLDTFRDRALKAAESLNRVSSVGRRAGLALGAVTGALAIATRQAAAYADQFEVVASHTGLARESIQGLAFAAEQSNADLAQLSTGLRGFVRRAAEAASGNAQFLKGFEQLGLAQEDVRAGLSDIEGLFLEVAERTSQLSSTAEQSAVAMTLMSDAGRQLVPLLSQGRRGIEELMEQARDLGIVLDEDAVAGLSAFQGEMDLTWSRIRAASAALAADFLPVARGVLEWINSAITAFQSLGQEQRTQLTQWAAIAAAVLGGATAFGVLVTGAALALQGMAALGGAVSFMLSPWVIGIGLLVAGAAALAAAWKSNLGGIQDKAGAVWDVIKPLYEAAREKVTAAWEWTVSAAGNAYEWVKESALPWLRENVSPRLETAWEWAVSAAGAAFGWLKNTAWPWLSKSASTVWEWTAELAGNVWEWLKDIAWPWLGKAATTVWKWAVTGLTWFVENVVPVVVSALSTVWQWTLQGLDWLVANVVPFMQDTFSTVWNFVVRAPEWFRTFLDWISGASSSVVNWMMGAFGGGGSTGGIRGDGIGARLGGAFQKLWPFHDGGILPGTSGPDQFLAMLAPGEAVVPSAAMRGGWPAVLAWFQRQGVPGFQTGMVPNIPGLSASTSSAISSTQGFLQQAQDSLSGVWEIMATGFATVFDAILIAVEKFGVMLLGEERVEQFKASIAEARETLQGLLSGFSKTEQATGMSEKALSAWSSRLQAQVDESESSWDRLRRWLSESATAAQAWARNLVTGLPGVSEAMTAYENATMDAASGGLGLGKASGIAAASLALVTTHSDKLQGAISAVSEGFSALVSAIDEALGALGPYVLGGATGAAMGHQAAQMLDFSPMIGTAVGAAVGLLGVTISKSRQKTDQLLQDAAQAIRDAADSWRQSLQEGQFHEVVGATPDVSDLERQIDRLWDRRDELVSGITMPWEATEARDILDQIHELEAEIREIQSGAPAEVAARLKEILGVTARDLQGAVRDAFSAATAEEFAEQFGSNLESKVRDALITAFLQSSTMAPLFDALSTGITDAVKDAEITPDEMDALRGTIDEIRDRSEPLYDALVDLGLAGEDASDSLREMSGSLRNVPQIFKSALVRGQVADAAPIPALASGGYVPATPGGRIVRLSEGGEGEYVIPESRAGGSGSAGGDIHIHGDVYGWDDFRRKVAQAQAQNDRRSDLVFQGA